MASKTIRVMFLTAACYSRCNDMYVLALQACAAGNEGCQTSAAVTLDMCQENCSQINTDDYLDEKEDW